MNYFQFNGTTLLKWTDRFGTSHPLPSLGNGQCNLKAPTLFTDEGKITEKSLLPIKSWSYGPRQFEYEKIAITIGGLRCEQNTGYQTPPCPTDDSQFDVINNRCVCFETTKLTYDQAIENCKEKLKDYGGGGILYEPNSIAEQKRIVDMAYERWSDSYWTWIGVTDKTTEGQFTYNSNNQPINFTPNWHVSVGGSRGRRQNCIIMYVDAPSGSSYSKWLDDSCTYTVLQKYTQFCLFMM